MTDYLKVEGHEHLIRDMGSKAIVNTNRYAYMAAVERSKNAQKQIDEIKELTEILEKNNNWESCIKDLGDIKL